MGPHDTGRIYAVMSASAIAWPQGQRAAMSLTFDDGLSSQLKTALPLLNQHAIAGTFYVNPRSDYETQLAPWQNAVAQGHELGNHTVTHPCSGMFGFARDQGRRPLEELSLADMDQDIKLAQSRLDAIFPHQGPVSFAYPCYQAFVGRGASHQSYVPVVLNHCVAGRARGERLNDPAYCDLYYLGSIPCEHKSGKELVVIARDCIEQRRWAILTFHGIDEGHLPVTGQALRELLEFVAERRSELWTDTVCKIAQHLAV